MPGRGPPAEAAAAQIDQDAAELFGRMRAAHGGAALDAVTGYREEGALLSFGPTGEVVQESPYRTVIDHEGRRVRTELLQGGEVVMVQQAGPEGAYAWSAVGGEIPVTQEQAADIMMTLGTGIHGLIRGLSDADSATLLGETTLADVTGTGLEVVRGGRAVVLLAGEDGRLLGESYEAAQIGTIQTVYTDHETVEGVLVPTAYESYAFGMKILGGRLDAIELRAELGDEAFAAVPQAEGPEVSEEALAWLRENAVPLDGVEAGAGFEDLERFGEMVGDARVVALGEQTHGTSEFFSMKHRLLEYLVVEKGFTLFAIEANMPESFLVNDYVMSGEGNSQALLQGLYFWTWYTQEVLDMIEWIRVHNKTAEAQVSFVGFDMQFPNVAIAELRQFLGEADPDLLAAIEPTLTAVEGVFTLTAPPEADDLAELQQATTIAAELEENRARYVGEGDEATVERAIQNARIVAQAVGTLTGGVAHRDAAMASNVEWLLERYPDEKMVIWAHNGHVAEAENWMGGHLHEALGNDYFSVAFSFYEGEYRAVGDGGVGVHAAGPALEGSLDAVLNRVGPGRFYLDLRNAEATPAAAWLAEERLFRTIGAVAGPPSATFAPLTLADEFDAVIFIRESTASEALEPVAP